MPLPPADQYQRLVESSPDGILVVRNNRIDFLNPAAVRLFGAAHADDIVGKSPFEVLHPDSHGIIRGRLERLLKGEIVPPLEERIVRLDGTVIDVEVNTNLVEGGEGPAIQVTVRDIADRKRREAVLRESEERLMLAFAGAREGVWDWNVESGEVVYSPRWKEMLGYQGDEIFPHVNAWEKLLHPDDRTRADALNDAVIRGQSTYEGEFRLLHREGHYITVLTRGLPIRNAAGAVIRIVGTHLDITERKRTESALRESEERLTLAFAGAQEGIWDWNLETDAVNYSSRWKQMLGYADDEIESHISAWERLVHPDDRALADQAHDSVARGQPTYEAEFRLRHKDGHYVQILSRGFPVRRDPGGRVVRIVGTHFDLTERRKREAERARTELLAHLVFVQEDERRRIARDMHDQFGEQLTALSLRIALLRDACGERADLANHVAALDRDRRTSRSRRGSARVGAPADRARRSRAAGGARQLHPGVVRTLRHRRGAAHIGAARRAPRLGGRDRAVPDRAGGAQQRRQALARQPRGSHPGAPAGLRPADPGGRRGRDCAETEGGKARQGFGLVGMRERATLVGANLEIESTPGKGTTILVRIAVPLRVGQMVDHA